MRKSCSAWRRLQGPFLTFFQYRKVAYKKDGERLFTKNCTNRTRHSGFKLKKGRLNFDIGKTCFYNKPGETLEQVAQRSCGCPIAGNVQGQAGWGFEQLGLVEGVPAHGRGVGTRWSLGSLPTQTIL